MKFLLLALLVSFVYSKEAWESHKLTFGKVYSPQEETYRRSIFEKNLIIIEEHNKKADEGLFSYRLGVNKFTDLEYEEFIAKYTGFVPMNFTNEIEEVTEETQLKEKPPKSRDWRDIPGRVGPIKQQGQCGYVANETVKNL